MTRVKTLFLALLLCLLPSLALAGATLLPNGKQQFTNGSGVPLANGTVATFLPGTTTPSATWQDPLQTILNTNPITLDSNGMATIWGAGNYRQVVTDATGTQLWDQLTYQLAGVVDDQNTAYAWGSTATGTSNNFIVSINPAPSVYTAGLTIRFLSNQTITGAVHLNVNGVGSIPVTKLGNVPLISGDISSGQLVQVTYDGTQFELTSVPGSLQATPGQGLRSSAGIWSIDPAFDQGALGGLQMSNDVTTPNVTIDLSPGYTAADSQTALMLYPAPFTKNMTSTWVVGAGNGCLDSGLVTLSTWYHLFAIARLDTGVADILCSASATAPVLPVNYTVKRYIGSFATDGSSNIKLFSQNGDEFLWPTPVPDISTNTLSTTPALFGLGGVPQGLKVNALLRCNTAPPSLNSVPVPTVTTELSGSGTYTTPPNTTWLTFRMVGGGGGGGGNGSSGATNGSVGGNTTFTSFTAGGGVNGQAANGNVYTVGGTGGVVSGTTPNIGLTGGNGGGGSNPTAGTTAGTMGGASPFGGIGTWTITGAGGAAQTNTGSGGGGAAGFSGVAGSGSGGGAGAYVESTITSPAPTFAYSVGAGGTAGVAGASGLNGGLGGSGMIVVTAYSSTVGAFQSVLLNSPDESTTAVGTPVGNVSLQLSGLINIRTNVTQQIRAVAAAASTTLNCSTYGWIDPRGRYN